MYDFLYFAYGSNMLTTRLRERCPSASPAGLAYAPGFVRTFDKPGRDGSGKATIVRASPTDLVSGVVFRISRNNLSALDRAEGGYIRQDDFTVAVAGSAELVRSVTYIAPPEICRNDLLPFDWYLELIRAGLREHGISGADIERLSDIPVIEDADLDRARRMFAIAGRQERS